MKKHLLFLLLCTFLYTIGFSNPNTGRPLLKSPGSFKFSSIMTIYQSSADDGGNLIEYPQAYNYVTPNTTVWLFVTYPSGTPSWSYQGGNASTGQWNSYLGAWEFYMPSHGFGIFQVTVGNQTAMYTILSTDYLNLSVNDNSSLRPLESTKESTRQEKNLLPVNNTETTHSAKNELSAVLQRKYFQSVKK